MSCEPMITIGGKELREGQCMIKFLEKGRPESCEERS